MQTQTQKIVRMSELVNMVGLKRASIYLYIKAGTFPAPLKLGPKASGWLVSEVESWIDGRVNARDEQRGER